MKRLTKSQYEEIAFAIAHVRSENQKLEFVSNGAKKEREIMAEEIVTQLARTFRVTDDQFDWTLFHNLAK